MRNVETPVRKHHIQALEGVVHSAAHDLSATQVATLAAHPEAVRSALAAVATTLSSKRAGKAPAQFPVVETITGTEAHRVSVQEANRRLSTRTAPGQSEDLLTSDEMAARLGLKNRQSVHNRLRKGRIVGWQSAKRGYVFPAGQLDERGRPPDGLARIVPCFADGYAAWVWLTTPRPSLDGEEPLVLLDRGQSDRVATAAEGDAQGDFG